MTAASPHKRFLIGPGALDCNRGDQALLWQAMAALRRVDSQAEIAILSEGHGDPDDVQSRQTRRLGVTVLAPFMDNPRRVLARDSAAFMDSRGSVLRMAVQAAADFLYSLVLLGLYPWPRLVRPLLSRRRRETYDYLVQCDALIIKGGGYLYAHRGARWAYFLWFGLLPLMFAQRLRIKTLVLPNSLGPFESGWSRFLARRVFTRCHLLTVRERRSAQILAGLLPDRAVAYPDMAFGLESAPRPWAQQTLKHLQVPIDRHRCVGVTLRPWRFPGASDPQARYQGYIQAHVQFIQYLRAQDYDPVLFVHVRGPHAHEDDRIALQQVQRQLAEPVLCIDGDFDCRQLKALYGQMHAMLCTRFHSAIFCIAQQVPCVAINYQGHKAAGIMQEAGLSDFVLQIEAVTASDLIGRFESMQQQRDQIKQRMQGYMDQCGQRLKQLDQAVRDMLV